MVEKIEKTDAEIAAATGFGEVNPPADEASDNDESDEDTEDTDDTFDEESAGKGSDKKEAVKKIDRAESKSEDDEGKSEDDAEDADEDDTKDSKDDDKAEHTVPYSLLKATRQKVADLTKQLADAVKGRDEAKEEGNEDDVEDADDEVAAASKELAETLGIDEEGIEKILKTAVKLSSKKQTLPKEIADKLKILDEMQKESKETKEVAHFNKEWDAVDVKKTYPNAPESAIKEAKDLMNKFAHSKEHHTHDLDYIMFKHKKEFDTILKVAAKGKSGETGKRIQSENSEEFESESEESMVNIEDVTPEVMKAREAQDMGQNRKAAKTKDYTIHNRVEAD